MKALVLDFDGVISDSAREGFTVAVRTYRDLVPASRLRESGDEALYRGFLELIPLGNRAEDYGAALAALEAGVPLPDQAAYDRHRGTRDAAWLADYHKRFYEVRDALVSADPRAWLDLMRPYGPFVDLLRRRSGFVRYAIATARDGRSVAALLESYGISHLFAAETILDKDAGTSKTAHLSRLGEILGLEPREMIFVDDKLNHLDAVASLGVRCALAAWGYNGPREHDDAARRGHLVCRLGDVESQLFGSESSA